VLMCNSLAEGGHRGERPNELSGSWFRPKCLAGQRRAGRSVLYGGCGRGQQTRKVRGAAGGGPGARIWGTLVGAQW